MIYKDEFLRIKKYIEENCRADDYSVNLSLKRKNDIRFAQNSITQNMEGEKAFLRLDTAFGNQHGSATVNQLDEESLHFLIDSACSIASANRKDPEYMATSGPCRLPEVSNYYNSTYALRPEKMVEDIIKVADFAESLDSMVSGIASKAVSEEFSATANGFYDETSTTSYSFSSTLIKGNLETKVERSYLDYEKFDIYDFIAALKYQHDALDKEPETLPRGQYTVILMPSAVSRLFSFMIYFMDRRTADLGLTVFSGNLGRELMGGMFSMRSSIKDRDLKAVSSFFNSTPAADIDWVKSGFLENLPCDRFYASKTGVAPSYPYNIIIEGGKANLGEMMKTGKKGLIINDLWYLGAVDARKGEITGMTRDGVLYFEDGEIRYPVKNFRFNEIPVDVSKRIIMLGPEQLVSIRAKVPGMMVSDFNFVDNTSF